MNIGKSEVLKIELIGRPANLPPKVLLNNELLKSETLYNNEYWNKL